MLEVGFVSEVRRIISRGRVVLGEFITATIFVPVPGKLENRKNNHQSVATHYYLMSFIDRECWKELTEHLERQVVDGRLAVEEEFLKVQLMPAK